MTHMHSSTATGRLLTSAVASAALLLTAVSSTFAAPVAQQAMATVVGTVTCGADETTPAARAFITVAGSDVSVRADAGGKFTLAQVPAGQSLTVEAMSDPLGAVVSSRPDISLQAGETLDIGNLDLAVCPQSAPATSDQQVPDPSLYPQQ